MGCGWVRVVVVVAGVVVVASVRCGGGCGCRRGSMAVDIGVGLGPVVVMGCGFCGGGGSCVGQSGC